MTEWRLYVHWLQAPQKWFHGACTTTPDDFSLPFTPAYITRPPRDIPDSLSWYHVSGYDQCVIRPRDASPAKAFSKSPD
ncbi:hypothetical protein N7536_003052 [Penicillium majusculum]|uniref:Uncharacterized protein n=1 Tax=Penicillium solitum TaxID=60172 RepID=A0A1V6RDK9_9EURO|nr:uncharacterized protein PENSOL_c007G00380 [Penicillium solitum]KAJ5700039.1 hypothetical protein N7536_003052 [Penicillium majusculum]OQD99292.1 hypothetical protein PENSOL_c007G00380 [Penicillium solitum]